VVDVTDAAWNGASSSLRRRPAVLRPAGELLLLVLVTLVVLVMPRTATAQTVGDLAILLAVGWATGCCIRAARRGGRSSPAWWLLALSTGIWSAGQMIWTWFGLTRHHDYPFPSAADAGYLGYVLPLVPGLLLFPRAARQRFAGLRAMLDAAVIASSLLFLSWAIVLGPALDTVSSGLAQSVTVAYPVVDLLVASLVLALGMRVAGPARRTWLLLGLGLLLLTVTDSTYVAATTAGQTGTTGSLLAVGWAGAFLLVARAASRPFSAPHAEQRHFTVVQELLPTVPALAAVIIAALHHFRSRDSVLIGLGLVVLGALAAQQVVAAFEKVRLANGLEQTIALRTGQLRSTRDRFQAMVQSSEDAIFSVDRAGAVTSWNPAAERLFGYPAEEILRRPVSILQPAGRDADDDSLHGRVLAGGNGASYETERVRRDGSHVAVALTVSPIIDDDHVVGISMIGQDITARRRQHAELTAARAEALEASRAKSEFLATMSHEIRTPMNGVIGLTGLLLDTPLDDVQRRDATGVRGAGEALLAIIDDILDFSKLEAGKVELEEAPFDPRRLVDEVGVLLAGAAAAKHVELLASRDPAVPALLRGDAGRLRQVLINLVSNAVKFTSVGEVSLRARLQQTGAGAVVTFSITDTGIGIDPADQARLFEPFIQADASTTRRYGGTGLGLAICRRLAIAMKGQLSVDSHPGSGSAFHFTVPLGVVAHNPEPVPPAPGLRGLRVLVVDDNATNRLVLSEQLALWHLVIEVAADAAAGWQLLQDAAAQGRPFDVAVLDMCMPDVNGLQLAARIDTDPVGAGTRTMILTSGGALDQASLAAAGVGVCVSKPVRSSELHDALVQLAAAGRQPPVAAPPLRAPAPRTAAPPTDRGRVLVVEDNEINQLVAQGLLRSLSYDVDVVGDGRQALAALEQRTYTAVLMDCHMPEMDGFDATRELRRREGTGRRTPVLAMTAGVLTADRDDCVAAGMDDFVAKPVDAAVLEATLQRWTQQAAPACPTAPTARNGTPQAAAGLDDQRLSVLRRIGPADGWGLLPTLVESFRQSVPEAVTAILDQPASASAQEAVLHRLRGAAANLGATALAGLCARLEEQARYGTAVSERQIGELREAADAASTLLGAVVEHRG